MYYLGDMGKCIYADCECGHTNKIPKEFCNKREEKRPEYDLTQAIKCEKCGIETNEIIQKPKVKKGFWGAVRGLVAGSMGKDKVIITCLNCGHKWKPNKRK